MTIYSAGTSLKVETDTSMYQHIQHHIPEDWSPIYYNWRVRNVYVEGDARARDFRENF